MRSEHDDAALLVLTNNIPGKAAGVGVHARGGLVQEHDARAADESDPHGQLAALATRKLPWIRQIEIDQKLCRPKFGTFKTKKKYLMHRKHSK